MWERLKAVMGRQVDFCIKAGKKKVTPSSAWHCAAVPQPLGDCARRDAPESRCQPENSMLLLHLHKHVLSCFLYFFFFFFLHLVFIFFYFGQKIKSSYRKVMVDCSWLVMRPVNANTPDAVINSNCSSFQSHTHSVVRVTESDQCCYWRPDGLQGFCGCWRLYFYSWCVFYIKWCDVYLKQKKRRTRMLQCEELESALWLLHRG